MQRRILGIAASLLILFAVSFMLWTYWDGSENRKPQMSLSASSEKLILNDGSLVWFQPGSKIAYYENTAKKERIANFSGEALFEVAKNPDQPFIINVGELSITVLGTSFSLKSDNENLELTVITGKVSVSNMTEEFNLEVRAYERLNYSPVAGPVLTSIDKTVIHEAIANTEYNMQFNQAGLQEILLKIEQKFNVTIKLQNKQIANCRISTDFTDNSLESTLDMLSEILEAEYTRKADVITLIAGNCE